MVYRTLNQSEIEILRPAEEYCFHIPSGDASYSAWIEHRLRAEDCRGIFGDDGRLKAGLINFPMQVYMAGAKLGMGGIAGVVSWPENRREGNVGRLLCSLLAEEKDRGVPLSGLFPFKQAFYRRFGWEVSSYWLMNHTPVDQFAPYRKQGGHVQRLMPGEADWRVLERIYASKFAGQYGYVVRETEHMWTNWVNPAWSGRKCHTAMWAPEPGAEPEGYVLYRFDKNDAGERELLVEELVGLSLAAERGLWGFIAQHDSMAKAVAYRTRRSYPLTHLLENTRAGKTTLEAGWMLRLVDLKAAFEQRPWPGAPDGRLTIGVTDSQAPWNAGTWSITFEGGHARVEAAPAETPELSAPIQVWNQVYAGAHSPSQCAASGQLASSSDRALKLLDRATWDTEMWYYEYY